MSITAHGSQESSVIIVTRL